MAYVVSGMNATEEVRQLTCATELLIGSPVSHDSGEAGETGLPQSQSSLSS